jgi:hydrogenase-4 component F
MTSALPVLLPALGAVVALLWRSNATRPLLLPLFGAGHLALTLALFLDPPAAEPGAWLAFDALARVTLPPVSLLFLGCAAYGVAYLRARAERGHRLFVALLLAVLGMISAGLQAQHLGVLWISTESVTLATVPLLHWNGTPRALEAAWKYLLVGGTGIALSLFGSFCLGYASLHGGCAGDLTFASLAGEGADLSRPWVLMAWVLLLAGYGTKMGLAPMHTWKPDAYGEAPGLVGALLAGGVTTVAFVALLRVRGVIAAAGAGAVADRTLLAIGAFSVIVAALFLLGTRDYKRMLAYSSVEHMGILTLGASFGPAGTAAALFHVWSNGLTKGALFLSAGTIRRASGSSSIDAVRGLSAVTPRSAAIFVVAAFAVSACPPFGPFFSELAIVRAGLAGGRGAAVVVLLAGLLLAFVGITRIVFAVVGGRPRIVPSPGHARVPETLGVVLPAALLLGVSLWLGLFAPEALRSAWSEAARLVSPTR